MKDLIFHRVPDKKYFAIAVPESWLYKPIDGDGAVITLQDPQTNVKTSVQITETWTFDMADFTKLNGWSLLIYDLPAVKMAFILRAKYPEIDQTNVVRFALLKKL